MPYYADYNKLEVAGDTVIDEIPCKIIQRRYTTCNLRGERDYVYESDDRVYYYESTTGKFNLLYDFTKNAGEYWESPITTIEGSFDTLVFHVASSELIMINDLPVRVLETNPVFRHNLYIPFGFSFRIFEFIGCEGNFFPWHWWACDGLWNSGLRCYVDIDFGLYITGIVEDCEYNTVGVKEMQTGAEKFSIIPNPSSGSFRINTPIGYIMQSMQVKIFNRLGKEVTSLNVNPPFLISEENMAPGLYFIQIYDSECNGSVVKFIKF